MHDPFHVLGIDALASSLSDVKEAYRRLAMIWHPDKNGGSQEAQDKFAMINRAYELIGSADGIARERARLNSAEKTATEAIVDLDDLAWNSDRGVFEWPCRCGTVLVITEQELDKGVDTYRCTGCSFAVLVEFDKLDGDE